MHLSLHNGKLLTILTWGGVFMSNPKYHHYLFLYISVCECFTLTTYVPASRGQKRVSNLLRLEFQMVMDVVWVLRIESKTSEDQEEPVS